MSSKRQPAFDVSVFVNCPFDGQYKPLVDAILFAVHDCGFLARTALEVSGSGETRLDKIVRIIRDSRFSIHDVSRVELTPASPLPRFNMPFECGLAFGAMRFQGPRKAGSRDLLLLAAERFQDKLTLSDLAGQDAAYHEGDSSLLIRAVRKFLASKANDVLPPGLTVRGGASIATRYARFCSELPTMVSVANITMAEILSFDYVAEWLALATRWQAMNDK